jgi:hypothetical protein
VARQESPIGHPVFRKALADKVEMKLEVTPNESKQIQKIAPELNVFWAQKKRFELLNLKSKVLFFSGENLYSMTHTFVYDSDTKIDKRKLFSFKDDCFIDDIKHKNLRQALADKVNIRLMVTPEQSKVVQEIAFADGVNWTTGYESYKSELEPYLYIWNSWEGLKIKYSNNHKKFKNNTSCKEFSFKNDCFVEYTEEKPTIKEEKQWLYEQATKYTITEYQMENLLELLHDAINYKIVFRNDMREMQAEVAGIRYNTLKTLRKNIERIKTGELK